jgi:uncharacterized protein with GYD domain
MPIYATLARFTAQEVTSMANPRKALEEGMKMATGMGIKLIGTYATLGPHDVMLIYEAHDEKIAAGMAMGFSAKWGGRSETWTLIPVEELPKLAAKRRRRT